MKKTTGIVIGLVVIVLGIFGVVSIDERPEAPEVNVGAAPESTQEYSCVNGDCVWFKSEGFRDASTTLATIRNPFGATSTVSAIIRVPDATTATSSTDITCATSTTAYPTTLSVGTTLISSSTVGANVGGTIFSGVKTGSTGVISAGASSVEEIVVAPGEYLACMTGVSAGVTNSNNTFNGVLKAKWRAVTR